MPSFYPRAMRSIKNKKPDPVSPRSTSGLFRTRNFQLFADCANRAVLNFSVTRNAGDLSLGRIQPDGVTATLAIKDATFFAKIALQVDPFHESGNSIGSRTA